MPEFKIPTHPDASRRIRKYPEVSGIGTSSAEICMRPVGPLLAHATALGPCNGREREEATSALVRARRECGDPSSRLTSTRRDTRRRKPPPQYRTRTWVENKESSPNTNTGYQIIIINRISNLVRILIFYGYQIFLEYNGNCLEITA